MGTIDLRGDGVNTEMETGSRSTAAPIVAHRASWSEKFRGTPLTEANQAIQAYAWTVGQLRYAQLPHSPTTQPQPDISFATESGHLHLLLTLKTSRRRLARSGWTREKIVESWYFDPTSDNLVSRDVRDRTHLCSYHCTEHGRARVYGGDRKHEKQQLENKRIQGLRFLTGVTLVSVAVVLLGAVFPLMARQLPASAGPADPALIEDLVAANRILYEEGIVDGFGHVSVRHDQNPNRFLLSRSMAPALVTGDDIVEYDLDANPVDLGDRSQYLERFIHAEIYRARPDVQAIVHNHSPGVVPFGVSSVALRPLYHMAAFIGEGIPVFDIRDVAGTTAMLVSDRTLGRRLAETLTDRPAVLMRGHGVAVVGADLLFAVGRSIYLELNARLQAQALGLGGTVKYLDPGEAQAVLDLGENQGYRRPWALWKQKAMGQ